MKDNIKTFLLVGLVCITLFLAANIWIDFPVIGESQQIEEDQTYTQQNLEQIFFPTEILVNFREKQHKIISNSAPLWRDYSEVFADILYESMVSAEKPIEISEEDYLKLHWEKSLVFKFEREYSGGLIISYLDKKENDNSPLRGIQIKNLYFSGEGDFIVIGNSQGYYKVEINNYNLHRVKEQVDEIEVNNNTPNYINFYEAYNIVRDIYVPENNIVEFRNIVYENNLVNMEQVYTKNLAERFLDTDIEYIREIRENQSNIYVYENKILRLNVNGILEYENLEEFEVKERNFFTSMNEAVDFLFSKTGLSGNIMITNVEPIDENENTGYRFNFTFLQDNIPVYINSENTSYISIDIFNRNVRNLTLNYRRPQNNVTIDRDTNHTILKIDELISRNTHLFQTQGAVVEDVIRTGLNSIRDLDIVYFDENKGQKDSLKLAWKIALEDRIYIFDAQTGVLLMER